MNSLPSGNPGRHCSSAGFSMIEVLVSIVVLSFGLLGMVGLQAASLRANRDARLQSTAIVMAREFAEMMRGNKDVALLALANPYLLAKQSSPLTAPTPTYCLAAVSTGPCATTTAAAQSEVTDWLARLDAELPGATVAVCRDSSPYDANGLPLWACTSTNATDPIVVKIGWTISSKNSADTTANALEKATVPAVILPVTPGSTL